MEGVRQRRLVAETDSGGDVSQSASHQDKDVSLKSSEKIGLAANSLPSESFRLLTQDLAGDEKNAEWLDDEGKHEFEKPHEEETLWTIGFEVFLPFIVAGLGMSTTGITLHYVKVSTLFYFVIF